MKFRSQTLSFGILNPYILLFTVDILKHIFYGFMSQSDFIYFFMRLEVMVLHTMLYYAIIFKSQKFVICCDPLQVASYLQHTSMMYVSM